MKRIALVLIIALFVAVPVAGAQTYLWTVSNSTTDPFSNSGPIAPGPSMFAGNLYLWLACALGAPGMAAAEMDVVELRGGGAPTGFSPLNGYLNAGSATALLLAVGGCPSGFLVAGVFTVGPDAFLPDIELCLVNSALNDRNITVACGGVGYQNNSIGFVKTGGGCSDTGETCFTSLEPESWGRIKGLYR